MRKIILTILIIVLAGFFSPVYSYAEPVEKESDELVEPPSVSAQNAIVIELKSGRVLYEKNADEKAFPASTTKIMTALLALENADLKKKVKVSQSAVGMEGSSIYLEKGEILPLEDLLYGLMLRSGNDAAVAIAETIGGSTENFVAMMNERAEQLGAERTHFMNPNGLHHQEHYTTVRDMSMIAREAMHNPEFKTIAKAKSWTADRGDGKYNYFYNKNKVVYQYDGGTGIKIGYTKAAGRTLVASSERNGIELICTVMNAPDWFNDTYKLMDYVYDQYEARKIISGDMPLKALKIQGGDKNFVYIGAKSDITFPFKKGEQSVISVEYKVPNHVKAPVSRWQEAGELQFYADGKPLFSEPLYYLEDIEH